MLEIFALVATFVIGLTAGLIVGIRNRRRGLGVLGGVLGSILGTVGGCALMTLPIIEGLACEPYFHSVASLRPFGLMILILSMTVGAVLGAILGSRRWKGLSGKWIPRLMIAAIIALAIVLLVVVGWMVGLW